MKIAVIGGGAAGIITSYMLQDAHEVHLFEKQAQLGGNVQTLGRNAAAPGLADGVHIENGVLGFHTETYGDLHRFLTHLKVGIRPGKPTVALFNQSHYFPNTPKQYAAPSVMAQILARGDYRKRVNALRKSDGQAVRRVRRYDGAPGTAIGELLDDDELTSGYLRSLFSLSFSTPWEHVDALPAAITAPFLKAMASPDWFFVEGGVYAYFERILSDKGFAVHTGAGDVRVQRRDYGVDVIVKGEALAFDKVVIAATPGQARHILSDADEAEAARFDAWADRAFPTTAHTDDSLYGRFRKAPKSPMDMFLNYEGVGQGYNTYMNGMYGLPKGTPYCFSWNLDDVIDECKVLHRADHIVPCFTVDALATQDAIKAAQGERHTYFSGAWLGNGLHNSAVVSAMDVARLLDGQTLD